MSVPIRPILERMPAFARQINLLQLSRGSVFAECPEEFDDESGWKAATKLQYQ